MTQEKKEKLAHNDYPYGSEMPIGSRDRSLYERKKESFLNGLNAAINYTHCCDKLPNIKSEVFRKWYLSDGYNETMNNHILCKNGFDYDKYIVFKHYCNLIEFGN